MKTKLLLLLLMFCLFKGFSSLQAQTITVTPAEFTEGMMNPLMGLRENVSEAKNNIPYNTVVRCYIEYNLLDNASTDGLQKILNYTNTTFKDFEKYNIKVIVRVILQYSETEYFWPADLPSSERNYTSAVLRSRVLKTVANMGKAWDNDPRIAWVEMGLIGKWGEQQSPMDIEDPGVKPDNKSWAQILAPAFKAAFVNKKVQVRGMTKFEGITAGFEPGTYWDNWASYSSMICSSCDYNTESLTFNKLPYNRYKKVPMGGEIAYGVGTLPALIGNNVNDTYKNAGYRRWIKNCAAQCRTSVLGMEYSDTDQSATAFEGLKDLQKGFGYRFLIKEFQCSQQTSPGGSMTVNAKIVNAGIAPFYEKWPLALVIIDQNTKQIVYKSVIPSADITTWMPGENYDWKTAATLPGTGTEKFLTPATINNISANVTITTNLATGSYYAGLAILDPTTNLPGIFFSVKNFFKAGNVQPLCQIGIGVAPSNPTLTNVTFDNYDFVNDSRVYSLSVPSNVPVTGVSVAPSTLSVGIALSGQLTATVLPSSATNKNVNWTSSNAAIAIVDASGKVTGLAQGSAIITATTVDGGFKATSSVTVLPAPPCILPWSTSDFTISVSSPSYSSGPIDISCATSVKLHMELSETDYFEADDNLTVSYKVNGVTTQVVQLVNDFNTGYIVDINTISGNTLEIIVTGVTQEAAEVYFIKNVSVTSNEPIVKQDQTINFPAIAAKTFGDADFNAGATASSGLAVTYTSSNTAVATIVGSNIHIVGAGTVDITASQAGNVDYNAAPSVVKTLTVNKATQSITFPAISSKLVTDADFSPGASASSGLAVSYTSSNTAVATIVGGNIHIVDAGTSTITASQIGNANYNAAISVTQTLIVTSSPDVEALNGWNSGPNNPKVAGNNRMMVVMVMGENTTNFLANTVTYGGQAMTLVTDKYITSGSTTYTAIFILKETGVNAATSGTINVNWSVTPAGSSIYSVLLGNVDQTATIVKANHGLDAATTISNIALAAASGDMVVMCGATGNNNTITFNNAFTKENESSSTWGDGVTGWKKGTGANETPSFTQSASGRMTICAIVAKKATTLKTASIASAINDIANATESSIRIYPNPASSMLNIEFANAEIRKQVKVFNSVGQLIHSIQTQNATAQIDVKSLNIKGIIVVQVISGNSITNHRVLIK